MHVKTLYHYLEPINPRPGRYLTLDLPLQDFISLLKTIETEMLILHNTSVCFRPGDDELDRLLHLDRNSLHHLLVEHNPVDTYITSRDNLITILEGIRKPAETSAFGHALFNDILPDACDSMENISGEIVFNRNLKQFYDWHLYNADTGLPVFTERTKRTSLGIQSGDSIISAKGSVVHSHISTNCTVHGSVIHSFVFPGVQIEEGCIVKDSIIMNDNTLGKYGVVENTLILPNIRDMGAQHRIGENVLIGKQNSKVKNRSFPEQVYDGLTVIGSHARIGDGTVIEPGCFIDTELSGNIRKREKRITRGSTVAATSEDAR